ncbi:GntR family transcriptional regulator [Catenuloplanes indicus]|uniref:GntR family transcriptional regulator n=1 Tax=Catenuloplanes indicus TaxID=137267 RepID=A0AAE3VTI1_9ACTN|nr:GntR family transcriptional regulator [Catenuloplanes indicus]MDQ0363335.1 GntR family transcriptional regulator [Catenuloplanes indicus]MDQ0371657.1 GntR family transcriptional regulator [Catenuloplanes indicus]
MNSPTPPPKPKVDRERSAQIAAEIRAQIMDGNLPPGSQAPSIPTIAEQYDTGRSTAQNAYDLLKEEGYLEGRRGSGTFVRTTPHETIEPADYGRVPLAGEAYPWITRPATEGRPRSIDLRSVGEVPAPGQVAAAFGIQLGDPVICREQVFLLDGAPVEYDHIYFPVDLGRGTRLAEARRIKGGAPAVLAEMGRAPAAFDDLLATRGATMKELEVFGLSKAVPMLRTFRVVHDSDGAVISAEVIVKPGNRWQLRYRWKPETSA